ncbi:MAG: hypothetical protein QOD68_2096 [Actinomycetota bacterium]|nr:hypothetical protein [Actinomycetota bacterium]
MRWPSLLVARGGRVRLRGVRTFKSTLAAVTAYVVALPLSDNPRPVLAPLTALLVVQLTLYETVRRGLMRVVSVVLGVLFAAALSTVVPLTWWSLGLAVAVSLVIGRLFRLGDDIAEVPISAMLILAVGGSDIAVEGRIVETVIGAVVGVVVGAAVAPPLYVRPASDAVQDVARAAAEVMRRIATEVRSEYSPDQADSWLAAARGLGRDILRADRVLATAETSLRYNPRAISRPHAATSLRSGLDAVERAVVSLRGVCRVLADLVKGDGEETVYGPDVRAALSDLLADVADAVESYGSLVGSEVVGPGPEDERLRAALAAAWADRHRLAGLLRHQDRLARDEWQLHGQLTSQIDQLLRDVDSEARAELRRTWPAPAPVVARLSRRRGR